MAIIELKDILLSKPEYGANLSSLKKGKYKYFTQSNISLKTTNLFVNETQNKIMHYNDFFISRAGTIDSYLHEKNEKWVFAGYLVKYNLNTKVCIPKYIYFWTKGVGKKQIYSLSKTGTTMPKFNPPVAIRLKINLPNLETQKSIIDIIEPLEILENNINIQINKINFFLKNIKVTDEKIKLLNILKPIKNPPKNLEQISAKVLMKNTTIISSLEKKGTYTTNSFYCPKKTFLFCSIRTYLQKYCILPIDADVNGTLYQFKITTNFTSLLNALQNQEFWEKTTLLSTGTKMPKISQKDFLNIEINKTKFEIKNLEQLLILQNKILIKLNKIKENLINLLIK